MLEWLGNFVTNPMTWVVITALLHFVFMFVEMFKWDLLARDVVKLWPREEEAEAEAAAQAAAQAAADAAKPIGFNMGLYNGFFAVGLTVTLFGWLTPEHTVAIQVFILICVVVAGIVGAMTLKRFGFLVQSAPAVIALILM